MKELTSGQWTSTACWHVLGKRESLRFSISALRLCVAQLELEICGLVDSLWGTRELGPLHGNGAMRLFGPKMSC
jgi:hypothetical protein